MKKNQLCNHVKYRLLAVLLCMVLTVATVTPASVVCATETSSTDLVGTSNTEDSTNTDPNGTLGKNSDVGIEVTKSITGEVGKNVKVSFQLLSNNTTTIRLKSVYPIVDTTFPFETSGDAYKIVKAGDDVEKQKALSASFKMKTRKDITSGYHSVRFIGEYEKTAADGTVQDYYVIKTINIYFSGSDVSGGSDDNGGSDSDSDSDDEGDSGYDDGGDTGYDDGGNDSGGGDAVAPKLIITGYDLNPKKVMAGDTFKITIHIQNTSKTTSVCNGKFLIGNEAGSFVPTSGSNAVFVESIPAGKIGDIEIEMKAGAELSQKNYSLVVKGDFDDGRGNNFTSSDSLTVPVYQKVSFEITEVSMTPEIVGVGDSATLMFTINNKSTAGVYNVKVSTKGDAVSAEESYVGNIAGSSSAYATLNVIGEKDNSDKGTITVVIAYEDAEGNTETIEQEVACNVSEEGSIGGDAEMEFDNELDFEDMEEDSEMAPWLMVVIGLGVLLCLGAIIGVIVFIVVKRKKRMAAILEAEDGEDDLYDENF